MVSPRISTRLNAGVFLVPSRRPLDRVRVAVNVVESQGMRVDLGGEHGVGQHSVTRAWIADSAYRPRRLSILGALCYVNQPQAGPDLEHGACEVLEDASPDWVRGLWDGFHGGADLALLAGPSRELYLDGLRAGHLVFAEITVECPECGERRHRRDEICRGCK